MGKLRQILLLFLVVFLVGCGGMLDKDEPDPPTYTGVLNETIDTGMYKITVYSFEIAESFPSKNGGDYTPLAEEYVYLKLDIRIENINYNDEIIALSSRVSDPENRKYIASLLTGAFLGGIDVSPIKEGESVRGFVFYEVPPDIESWTFIFPYYEDDLPKTIIDLGTGSIVVSW